MTVTLPVLGLLAILGGCTVVLEQTQTTVTRVTVDTRVSRSDQVRDRAVQRGDAIRRNRQVESP